MKRSRWVLAAGGIAGLLAVYLVVTPFVRDQVLQLTLAARERSQGEALAHSLVSSDSFLEYGATHPEQVAVACWELGDEANGIFFNAARLQPASQASALLVLSAFAREAELERPVSLERWERYGLPEADSGAHIAAVLDARARAAALQQQQQGAGASSAAHPQLRLGDLVRAMIRHADPSAMDALLDHLGRTRLTEHVLSLGFPLEAVPLPASAVQLSLLHGVAAPELLARFRALPRGAYADAIWAQFLQLGADSELRARSLERLKQHGTGFSLRESAELSAALAPRGSATRYARLMEQIASGELSGADYMRVQLEQPPLAAGPRAELEQLGGVRASEPGVYASVSYGRARGTRVLALMLRNLPMAVWLHLSSGNLLRRFEAELLGDEIFFEKAKARLAPNMQVDDGAEAAADRWVR
jgi:hypothetical protein